jgi:hypothetical protein
MSVYRNCVILKWFVILYVQIKVYFVSGGGITVWLCSISFFQKKLGFSLFSVSFKYHMVMTCEKKFASYTMSSILVDDADKLECSIFPFSCRRSVNKSSFFLWCWLHLDWKFREFVPAKWIHQTVYSKKPIIHRPDRSIGKSNGHHCHPQ